MVLTVIPLGPNSIASALLSPHTPCLATDTGVRPAWPWIAFMPEKLTMRPQPLFTMPGRQARLSHTAAFMSTSITRCQSASLLSRNGLFGRSAALFSSASTAPNALMASSAMRRHSSGRPTSPMTTIALTPNVSASLATLSQAARSLEPLIATLKPSSARPSTQARPMFLPAPVTSADLPFAAISDRSRRAQFLDLLGAHAEALQHRVGVLAELGRRLQLPGLRRGREVD